jgi:hypothetical protein
MRDLSGESTERIEFDEDSNQYLNQTNKFQDIKTQIEQMSVRFEDRKSLESSHYMILQLRAVPPKLRIEPDMRWYFHSHSYTHSHIKHTHSFPRIALCVPFFFYFLRSRSLILLLIKRAKYEVEIAFCSTLGGAYATLKRVNPSHILNTLNTFLSFALSLFAFSLFIDC